MTIHIVLTSISLVFIYSYIFFSLYLYKKETKEEFSIKNCFVFEVTPKRNSPYFYLNGLLWIGVLTFVANFVFFNFAHTFNLFFLFSAIAAFGIAVSIVVMSLTSFKLLREHLYASIGLIFSTMLLNGFILAYSIPFFRGTQDHVLLIPIIISGLCVLIPLAGIFFPNLFNLSYDIDAFGNLTRKKFYPLAFFEWILLFITPISAVSLILLA